MEQIARIKFVKWAGGKGQLIEQLSPLFPKKIERYLEPFVGSGAVFFHINQKYKPKEIIISDINEELINTYLTIKEDVESLILALKEHKENHVAEGKNYYYTVRAINLKNLDNVKRAARFIYLNKTCFNGLYRVNGSGLFNVPMGNYSNPSIYNEEELREISRMLKNTEIIASSFSNIEKFTKKNDFIYFDPPYYPIKRTSFTSYARNEFLEKEQKELADIFRKLDKRGCKLMLSNSDTEFIKNLYREFNIHFVQASRMINCDGSKRGKINELVITNY